MHIDMTLTINLRFVKSSSKHHFLVQKKAQYTNFAVSSLRQPSVRMYHESLTYGIDILYNCELSEKQGTRLPKFERD